MYIADFYNCQVRVVSGGTINAFAGVVPPVCATPTISGVPGLRSTPPSAGQPGWPWTAPGNVYIRGVQRLMGTGPGCAAGAVYKVTTNGNITRHSVSATQIGALWGSSPGAAWGVRVEGGEVYFTDPVDNVIDRVSTSGAGLAVVAGTGTAGLQNGAALTVTQFSDPTGLYVDGSGNIFVADTHNYAIREISGGTVSTIAGTGTQQTTPVNPTTGTSATSFELDNPFGVVEDNSGNVLIADYGADCILKVVPAGTISTWGGTCNGTSTSGANGVAVSATTLGGPSNFNFDSSGNLYVNEYDGAQIRVVSSAE